MSQTPGLGVDTNVDIRIRIDSKYYQNILYMSVVRIAVSRTQLIPTQYSLFSRVGSDGRATLELACSVQSILYFGTVGCERASQQRCPLGRRRRGVAGRLRQQVGVLLEITHNYYKTLKAGEVQFLPPSSCENCCVPVFLSNTGCITNGGGLWC